jgi:hypothetical protein
MRCIMAMIGTPNHLLKLLHTTDRKYTHQDSTDFTQTINSLVICLEDIMVTSEVASLFNDVLFKETMDLLHQQFSKDITSLLHPVPPSTYFVL